MADQLKSNNFMFNSLESIEEDAEDEYFDEKPESLSNLSDSNTGEQTKSSLEIFSQTEEYKNIKRKMNNNLWDFIQQNDEDSVKKLLDVEKYGTFTADPDAKGLNDWRALHMASAYGYKAICKVLIATGSSDVNARTSIERTPLHLATLHNHFRVVKLLVKSGADVNLKDNEDNTALHYASMQGYQDICEWLLNQSPVLELNSLGRSPFCVSLNSETFNIFLEYFKAKGVELPCTGYKRTMVSRTLRHNSREDYVNRLITKCSQGVNNKDLKAFNERPRFQFNTKAKKTVEKFVLPPSKVGPFDFKGIGQLGKGSFGEVYLVEKIDTGQQYALKVLKKEKVLGNNLVRYAFTERNILLSINHPFIVKLNYAFQTPEKLVMVMDFCPNGDLGTHLTREKKFTEEKARFYMAEILLALGELHKNGILFRDLKPENVVLDNDGHAKLTDFGLSKEGVSDEQLSKSFCGSIAYLAPEMLKRSGHTRSVDWYLLGVLSYEMVSGSPPFYSPNREQMFSNIQKAELKFPQFLSNECKGLIKELMNRDVHKRLGAGKRDLEEIKEHPFFAEIDWAALINREIPPPPIKPVRRAPKVVPLEKMFGKLETEVVQRVDGWSVLQPTTVSILFFINPRISARSQQGFLDFYDTELENLESQRLWAIDSDLASWTRQGLYGSWQSAGGNLESNFVSHDGTLWGIDANNEIHYRDGLEGSWQSISGQLVSIAVDYEGIIWGVNMAGNTFFRSGVAGIWNPIDGVFAKITVGGDGRLWAIDNDGNVSSRLNLRESWKSVPGPGPVLSSISVDGSGVVWATDNKGGVWVKGGLKGYWIKVTGSLVQISASSTRQVWGVDSEGQVWTRKGVHGEWIGVDLLGVSKKIVRVSVAI